MKWSAAEIASPGAAVSNPRGPVANRNPAFKKFAFIVNAVILTQITRRGCHAGLAIVSHVNVVIQADFKILPQVAAEFVCVTANIA